MSYARRRRAKCRCSLCGSTFHNKARCPVRGLAIWTNGCELTIARSAEEAAAISNDPIPLEWEDLLSKPGDWSLLTENPVRLKERVDGPEVQWIQKVWIQLNGAGVLASEGCLMPGRKAE